MSNLWDELADSGMQCNALAKQCCFVRTNVRVV